MGGDSTTHNWAITNCGVSPCTAAHVYAEINGTDAGEFAVVAVPGTDIVCGGSGNVGVQFRPNSVGLKQANLHIICSNCQTGYNSINQPIKGTGLGSPYGEITDMHASQTTYTHPGPAGANPTIYITIKNSGTGSGTFKAYIDGMGDPSEWESDPFTLAAGASSQKSKQFTGVFGVPAIFVGEAWCYRDSYYWTDDTTSCNVQVNFTWGDINYGASYGWPGPFQRGATVPFSQTVMVNDGNYQGTAYAKYYYKSGGTWISPSGWTKTETFTGGQGTEITRDHSLTIPTNMPLGVLPVGVIIWGQDETEPSSSTLDMGGPQHKTWSA